MSLVSSEDSFRSDLVDLLSLYSAVDKAGVTRVGVADTVGCKFQSTTHSMPRIFCSNTRMSQAQVQDRSMMYVSTSLDKT
jgi:isopropylmalate/homocitrate/citramalate synthase